MGKNKNRKQQQQQQQQQQHRDDANVNAPSTGAGGTFSNTPTNTSNASNSGSTANASSSSSSGPSSLGPNIDGQQQQQQLQQQQQQVSKQQNLQSQQSNSHSQPSNSNNNVANTNTSSSSTNTTTTATNNNNNNKNKRNSHNSSQSQQDYNNNNTNIHRSLYQWCLQEKQGILWVLGCAILGALFGFGIGSGWLTGEGRASPPATWRIALGTRIRSSTTYHLVTFQGYPTTMNPAAASWATTMVGGGGGGNGGGGGGGTSTGTTTTTTTIGTMSNTGGSEEANNADSSSSSSPSASPSSASSSSSTNGGGTTSPNHYHTSPYNLDPRSRPVVPVDSQVLRNDPSHPTVYAVLREAVVREKGGYVHPDLGFLTPAPCGASRGLGMVKDSYNRCQTKCVPGVAKEKRKQQRQLQQQQQQNNNVMTRKPEQDNTTPDSNAKNINNSTASTQQSFMQEEVLIKVPLKFQMTRAVALDTLLPRISAEVQRKANVHELDDAALIALLLAHERGVGRYSRWLPYIASLPMEPSCGYSTTLRPYYLDAIYAYKNELGLDVNGWPTELLKATQYAERISNHLARDYGAFLQHPKGTSAVDNIQWALCHVASRGIAGSQKHGALRLIPLIDLINHDEAAGGLVELTGKERLDGGNDANDDDGNANGNDHGNGNASDDEISNHHHYDFINAMEDDSGAFVVRSLRHGRRKALRPGQELLVNYNVPHYSALDWFVSSGFVPRERWVRKWEKMDAALPRLRRDGPFGSFSSSGGGSTTSASASGGSPNTVGQSQQQMGTSDLGNIRNSNAEL